VCKVPTNARALIERLPCFLGRTRMFITEPDMTVHPIANGLDARPTQRTLPEQIPSCLR
jgi:hypothetical protein